MAPALPLRFPNYPAGGSRRVSGQDAEHFFCVGQGSKTDLGLPNSYLKPGHEHLAVRAALDLRRVGRFKE